MSANEIAGYLIMLVMLYAPIAWIREGKEA